MKSRIVDYEIIRPLVEGEDDGPYLARPPARLGLGPDPVDLYLLEALDPAGWERQLGHLRRVAALGSAHLARLIEAGRADDDLTIGYYAAEHPVAGTLADRAEVLSRTNKIRAVADAAQGAHDLHEAGLAHGSIGPSTVLLAADGARLRDPDLPNSQDPGRICRIQHPAELEGTDPEVLAGEPPSRASDLWALGATLHRLLAGRSLYADLENDKPVTAVQRIMFERPVIAPDLEDGATRVIAACLARDPGDRPASAAALVEQLDTLSASR